MTPEEYIASVDEKRRLDVQRLHEIVQEVAPELEPTPDFKILAYGNFHYKYASGRELIKETANTLFCGC